MWRWDSTVIPAAECWLVNSRRGQQINHKPGLLWRQYRPWIYQSQCSLPWIWGLVPTVAGSPEGQSSLQQCWPADRRQMYQIWRPGPHWSPINCSDRRWCHEKRCPRTERTTLLALVLSAGKTVQINSKSIFQSLHKKLSEMKLPREIKKSLKWSEGKSEVREDFLLKCTH